MYNKRLADSKIDLVYF